MVIFPSQSLLTGLKGQWEQIKPSLIIDNVLHLLKREENFSLDKKQYMYQYSTNLNVLQVGSPLHVAI